MMAGDDFDYSIPDDLAEEWAEAEAWLEAQPRQDQEDFVSGAWRRKAEEQLAHSLATETDPARRAEAAELYRRIQELHPHNPLEAWQWEQMMRRLAEPQ